MLLNKLCYTRGTLIPSVMTMECLDEQALDLLSSPEAINVRLQRCLAHSARPESQREQDPEWDASSISYPDSAVWWPAPGYQADNIRTLSGELQLSKELHPSTEVPDFSIRVSNFSSARVLSWRQVLIFNAVSITLWSSHLRQ